MLGHVADAAIEDTPLVWWIIGFGGQLVFTSRFFVQWIASERARRSVIPRAFWWLSLVGSMLILAYSIYRQDPVFIMAQATGGFIYVRNLMLIRRSQEQVEG